MWEKSKICRFLSGISRSVKRKFSIRRRQYEALIDNESVPHDEYEYNECPTLFNCTFCFNDIEPQDGIILKKCKHKICKRCVVETIEYSDEAEISCPYFDCPGIITDREIRCFISYENYQRLLDRSLAAAEASNRQSFHCRTPNCVGWVEIGSERVKNFKCQVCRQINCIKCELIHDEKTCKNLRKRTKLENKKTKLKIKKMMTKRIIKKCPQCEVLIEKDNGCDYVFCTRCNTEFHWDEVGRNNSCWPKGLKLFCRN